MILIICEKPNIASDIAKVLNAKPRRGYYESDKYLISNASGHLYELFSIEDYTGQGDGSWNLDQLPFIPSTFRWKALPNAKENIATLKMLMNRATMVINAMDYDREAELIFYEIDQDLQINVPIKRLLITSHTEKDVKKGLNNLADRMVNLEMAALIRSVIDWILGINYTRAFTLKTGNNVTLSVGRVMLPTLNLLYIRNNDIKNFIPEAYYTLDAEFNSGNTRYTGKLLEENTLAKYDQKNEIDALKETLSKREFSITSKTTETRNEYPGTLYSLTLLQKEITNKYKDFTSDKVLEIAQKLYEHKYTTYPRTDSKHLDDTQVEDAKESLQAILTLPEYSRFSEEVHFHNDKRTFDSSKVSSHPALMPTDHIPDMEALNDKEKIIYNAIASRFLMHFLPAAEYEETLIITSAGDHHFRTKEKIRKVPGWQKLLEKQPEDCSATLLDIAEGITVAANLDVQSGKTSPPKKYGEGDLIGAMETCGEKVNDDEVLKGFTMGAASTRAETIKKLLKYNYAEKSGTKITITSLGEKVIEAFPIKEILDVTFTGRIEKVLKSIEKGEVDGEVFMERMTKFFVDTMAILKNADVPVIEKEYEMIGECPECGSKIFDKGKVYKCDNKDCKVIIYKNDKVLEPYKKTVTKTVAKQLIKTKKSKMKSLIDPSNKSKFDAEIIFTTNSVGNYCLRLNRIEG